VTRKALYEGIAKNLEIISEDDQLGISMLIPGNKISDAVWTFSGTLQGDTADRPFYGDIQLTCPLAETPACWQLTSLVIDGNPYTLAISQSSASVDLLPEEQETLVIANAEPLETVIEETSEQTAAPTPSPEAITSKLYTTVSDNVNARMGPGSSFDVAFKMPTNVPLTLLEEQDTWGHFEYVGANNEVGQIWIALSLVKEAE